ncbi:hypothetical protein L1887_48996 [Cichorium endivia]|nr:hypothetical protein L1887_48996 [Cichorium endivia]
MLQNLLTILKGQNEVAPPPKKPSATTGSSNPAATLEAGFPLLNMRNPFAFGSAPRLVPAPVRRAPNEDRVRTMVDMGFPANAARHALSRCQNNLNAATEYLLMHDDLVVQYRDNPDRPWNDDASAAATGAAADAATGESSSTADAATATAADAAPPADTTAARGDDEEWEDQMTDAPAAEAGDASEEVQDVMIPDAPPAEFGDLPPSTVHLDCDETLGPGSDRRDTGSPGQRSRPAAIHPGREGSRAGRPPPRAGL